MKKLSEGMKMRRMRAQVILVHQLGEQLRALKPGVKSPILTDMPRYTGGIARGIDHQMAKRDALERMLARESALMRRYEREARAEMDRMKPEMYAFCSLYYLSGMSVEEAAQTLGRSARQCMRYKREIEEEDGDGTMAENVTKGHLDKARTGVV